MFVAIEIGDFFFSSFDFILVEQIREHLNQNITTFNNIIYFIVNDYNNMNYIW